MSIFRSLLLSGRRLFSLSSSSSSSSSTSSPVDIFALFPRSNYTRYSPQLNHFSLISESLLSVSPFTRPIVLVPLASPLIPISRPFSSSPDDSPKTSNSKLVNFSLPSSDSDSESDAETHNPKTKVDENKPNPPPPPYDPFNKKPAITEPDDPKNLQEVFHKMRTEGLLNNAVKMFDALSKDGLTHEALELFKVIKEKGNMPDVVAHTAVIEAYMGAGQSKEGHKVFLRMLACGVAPNAYTYSVLIKGLAVAGDGKSLADAKKYVVEMMDKGMKPNSETSVAVFEGMVKQGKDEEGKEFLEVLKGKGFVPHEKSVREVLRSKRGPAVRRIMSIMFGK